MSREDWSHKIHGCPSLYQGRSDRYLLLFWISKHQPQFLTQYIKGISSVNTQEPSDIGDWAGTAKVSGGFMAPLSVKQTTQCSNHRVILSLQFIVPISVHRSQGSLIVTVWLGSFRRYSLYMPSTKINDGKELTNYFDWIGWRRRWNIFAIILRSLSSSDWCVNTFSINNIQRLYV